MAKPIQISIPKPCQENWENMTPAEKGRFCASCQKQVHDFTRSTDIEIAQAFKDNGNLCGLFLGSQLERDLISTQRKEIFLACSLPNNNGLFILR